MANVPTVIKHLGTIKYAVDLNGDHIERKDPIFVKSYQQWCRAMPYDNHFVYMSNRYGSTMKCTCGGDAGVVDYSVYQKYHESNIGPMMVCLWHMQNGVHADGSH